MDIMRVKERKQPSKMGDRRENKNERVREIGRERESGSEKAVLHHMPLSSVKVR